MSETVRDDLPPRHPASTDGVRAAMEAVYNWNYESEIDQLRTLYANALERQWVALRDLDWDREIDRDSFSRTFSMGGIPIQETDFWKGLAPETRWDVARRTATFMLSNFLHGEQGALMVAAQLVSAVPHMDGKFYASTQTLDEARHVEAFAAYIRKLGEVQPIAPGLKKLLDDVLATESWLLKAVGMQVVTEGLALFSFRDMRNQTGEPLLKQLLTYVSRDEARHTGYGVKYLNAVVPTLSEEQKAEIEDFAFESARLLIDSRAGLALRQTALQLWADAGVDPAEALGALMKERERIQASLARTGGRFGPIRGFVIPTLRSIGLFSERIQGHFDDMFRANFGAMAGDLATDTPDLPEDLEAWVNEGAEEI
ncbi:MAG: ferritin-like domain-containing protein [Myxococcota bacterium]|nr:ferritin-like domain-containing protein [Myxococcota bacterium]